MHQEELTQSPMLFHADELCSWSLNSLWNHLWLLSAATFPIKLQRKNWLFKKFNSFDFENPNKVRNIHAHGGCLFLTLLQSCKFHGTSWKRAQVAVQVEDQSFCEHMRRSQNQSQLLVQQSCRSHPPMPASWTYWPWSFTLVPYILHKKVHKLKRREECNLVPVPLIYSWSVFCYSLESPTVKNTQGFKSREYEKAL